MTQKTDEFTFVNADEISPVPKKMLTGFGDNTGIHNKNKIDYRDSSDASFAGAQKRVSNGG